MPPKTPPKAPDWDALVHQYGCREFIDSDPVQFPHRYAHSGDWRDIECIGLIAALFSYGRRDLIVNTLNGICDPLGPNPVETLIGLSPKALKRQTEGFYYRFQKAPDLLFLLSRLQEIYQGGESLKNLWASVYRVTEGDMRQSIHQFKSRFLDESRLPSPDSYGLRFLLADPVLGGTAKRFNMFLRWMVRQDDVDLGLWGDVTPPSRLMMPVDTHVSRMARQYRITRRKTDTWQTVEEITGFFRRLCPGDPVRYDFALFGLGIDGGGEAS